MKAKAWMMITPTGHYNVCGWGTGDQAAPKSEIEQTVRDGCDVDDYEAGVCVEIEIPVDLAALFPKRTALVGTVAIEALCDDPECTSPATVGLVSGHWCRSHAAKRLAEQHSEATRNHADKPRPEPKCPNCGYPSSEHPMYGSSGLHLICDMTYGRRGWRQLGVYDG